MYHTLIWALVCACSRCKSCIYSRNFHFQHGEEARIIGRIEAPENLLLAQEEALVFED